MNSTHKYESTIKSIMEWANSELEHVGRIVAVHDPDLQYSYALSTVNGMAYLKDALFEMVNDETYSDSKQDLLRTHDSVVRVMKHLVKDFKIDIEAIKQFNTRKVLSNLSYLKNSNNSMKTTMNSNMKPSMNSNLNSMNSGIKSPKNITNVPNNFISNVSSLGSTVNSSNTNTLATNSSNNLKMNSNRSSQNTSIRTNSSNQKFNSLTNFNNLAMNNTTMKNMTMNSSSLNNSARNTNLSAKNLNTANSELVPNTTTPALRSSIVSNANSMSQKMRGGKKRSRYNRTRR